MHTKEPWDLYSEHPNEQWIDSIPEENPNENEEGFLILKLDSHGSAISDDEKRANAKRIVRCVNACAGIAYPEIDIKRLIEALHVLTYANSDDENDYPDKQLFDIVTRASNNGKEVLKSLDIKMFGE